MEALLLFRFKLGIVGSAICRNPLWKFHPPQGFLPLFYTVPGVQRRPSPDAQRYTEIFLSHTPLMGCRRFLKKNSAAPKIEISIPFGGRVEPARLLSRQPTCEQLDWLKSCIYQLHITAELIIQETTNLCQ